jgi:hypothetical protein
VGARLSNFARLVIRDALTVVLAGAVVGFMLGLASVRFYGFTVLPSKSHEPANDRLSVKVCGVPHRQDFDVIAEAAIGCDKADYRNLFSVMVSSKPGRAT